MLAKPLALTFREDRGSPAAPSLRPGSGQLWIGAHWPDLALQAVETVDGVAPARREDRRPTVVVEAWAGRLKVIALNAAARRRGIRHGLDLSAAFAFSGALRVLERSHRAERNLLEALAMLGQRFTPGVSLEPPDGLLLEVHASLALFGGIEPLRTSLAEAWQTLAPGFRMVIAPTPLAALWLSRSGAEKDEEDGRAESLASRLGRLPLRVTRWPPAVLDRLEGMGVTTIAECLKLPRDGFARRVGSAYLDALDKSLGKCADPRAPFEAPEHLDFVVELFDESTSLPVFIDAVTRMTEPLARELQLRQAQVGMLQLIFEHRRSAPTVYRLDLLEGTSHGLRLLELLCDKLERITLPAPATALRLTTGPLEPAVVETGRLFKAEGSTESGALVRLVERLRGRLGESGVHGLTVAADHRPERAWAAPSVPDVLRSCAPRTASRSAPSARPPDDMLDEPVERPLWLLLEPEPLRSIKGKPHLGGRLRVIEGPERIESGWHDGKDIGRDYFIAVGVQGERLWVFRDRADGRWYLHGRFG